MSGTVDLDCHERVAVLTLRQEERLNAIDLSLARALGDAVAALAGRDDVGAVVLRGAGERAFSAGMDLKYAAESGDKVSAIRGINQELERFFAGLAALDLPSVAMLRGVCYGGGVHLAIEADFRFADDTLALAIPALKNRLYYPIRALTRLRGLVGPTRTSRLLLEGSPMNAVTLQGWGLVDEVHAAAAVEARTLEFAARLAAQPLAIVRDYRAIFAALDQGDAALASQLRSAALARAQAR